MKVPLLLLIDLRGDKSKPHVCAELSTRIKVQLLDDQHQLTCRISEVEPDVVVFEFDYPDICCLKALEHTKAAFPSIPILMVTEQHDEALAVWALRARVWDYMVKPVVSDDLYQTIIKITNLCVDKNGNKRGRDIVYPLQPHWNKVNTNNAMEVKDTTLNVIKYVDNHFHEKICISVVAKKCLISQYKFSREFKQENGITFREYLINYRLDKARELLNDSKLSVGDVSFAVGFLDHSYFARMFKSRVGLSPSEYRSRQQ